MRKFTAFLKEVHSFTKKKGGSLYLRIDECDMMISGYRSRADGETIALNCSFPAPKLLKRWKIKRWFKRLYKTTKRSFFTEFRHLPSLEIIDGEALQKALMICITFHCPYKKLLLLRSENALEITINRLEDWDFNPDSHCWECRERTEEAQAQT